LDGNLDLSQGEKLDQLLNEIEICCDPEIGDDRCNQFCLDCLALIRHKLPPIAADALVVVTDYREGRVPLKSVVDMTVKCWKYLDENHGHQPLDDPLVSAIRAVIFPLSAQRTPAERDLVDHLSFFLMLVNNVEPHCGEEEALLRKYYAGCLDRR
jgi:hypothetical protein